VTHERVWRRSSTVAFVDSEGRSALLDLDRLTDPPLVLEGSAAEIWQRVDGERETDQIVAELVELYGEPREVIAAAVESFLADLVSRGLIEEADSD
jgi:pyrroloquinoline quinone biosynthesis protein D